MNDNTPTTEAEPEAAAAPVEADPAPAAEEATAARGPRTNLEGDLKAVCDDVVTGVVVLPDGKQATPHVLAGLVAERRGDGGAVSAGAVTAALDRWVGIGFAELGEKPKHFKGYTQSGQTIGLQACKDKAKEARKAARAAEKAASAATEQAPQG